VAGKEKSKRGRWGSKTDVEKKSSSSESPLRGGPQGGGGEKDRGRLEKIPPPQRRGKRKSLRLEVREEELVDAPRKPHARKKGWWRAHEGLPTQDVPLEGRRPLVTKRRDPEGERKKGP